MPKMIINSESIIKSIATFVNNESYSEAVKSSGVSNSTITKVVSIMKELFKDRLYAEGGLKLSSKDQMQVVEIYYSRIKRKTKDSQIEIKEQTEKAKKILGVT